MNQSSRHCSGASGSGNLLGERRSGKLQRKFGPSESRTRTGEVCTVWSFDAAARLTWATSHVASTIQVGTSSKRADWLDWCTGHRILGPAIFLGLMTALFWCVFSVAGIPMGWIESFFAMAKDAVAPLAGEGLFGEFIVDGVIGSLEGTVIFVPQISMLFGLISLLEQSGYLARALLPWIEVCDGLVFRDGLSFPPSPPMPARFQPSWARV